MEVQPQFSPCIQTLGDRRRRGGGWLGFYPSLLEGVASSLPQNSLASHIGLSLTSLIESWKARVLSVPLYSGGRGGTPKIVCDGPFFFKIVTQTQKLENNDFILYF